MDVPADFQAVVQRQARELHGRVVGPHVIGIGKPEPLVEAMVRRQEHLRVADVPFPDQGRAVAVCLHDFADRFFFFGQSEGAAVHGGARQADPVGIAAGDQRGPGCAADRLGRIIIGETQAVHGHAVDVRGRIADGTVEGKIGETAVVQVEQDDVDGLFRILVEGQEGIFRVVGSVCAAEGRETADTGEQERRTHTFSQCGTSTNIGDWPVNSNRISYLCTHDQRTISFQVA